MEFRKFNDEDIILDLYDMVPDEDDISEGTLRVSEEVLNMIPEGYSFYGDINKPFTAIYVDNALRLSLSDNKLIVTTSPSTLTDFEQQIDGKGFIRVKDDSGESVLINANHVIEVKEFIYFFFIINKCGDPSTTYRFNGLTHDDTYFNIKR